jgi:hypothetical protein
MVMAAKSFKVQAPRANVITLFVRDLRRKKFYNIWPWTEILFLFFQSFFKLKSEIKIWYH